jgi:hypothetical protein
MEEDEMSAALEKARQAREAMKAQGVEIERLNPIEKAVKNPKSLRLAINAKCWDCSCGQRAEIAGCECKNCPLWTVRPYQKGGDNDQA